MIKKKYITPEMSVFEIDTTSPLALSVGANTDTSGVGRKDALSIDQPDTWSWDGEEEDMNTSDN